MRAHITIQRRQLKPARGETTDAVNQIREELRAKRASASSKSKAGRGGKKAKMYVYFMLTSQYLLTSLISVSMLVIPRPQVVFKQTGSSEPMLRLSYSLRTKTKILVLEV